MHRKVKKLQEKFVGGSIPEVLGGFYKGKVLFVVPTTVEEALFALTSSLGFWRGKHFYMDKQLGDEVFSPIVRPYLQLKIQAKKTVNSAFMFQTSIKKSYLDSIEVMAFDYNLSENPDFVRKLYSELVRLDEGKFLGKLYVKEGNALRFFAYYSLKKG